MWALLGFPPCGINFSPTSLRAAQLLKTKLPHFRAAIDYVGPAGLPAVRDKLLAHQLTCSTTTKNKIAALLCGHRLCGPCWASRRAG